MNVVYRYLDVVCKNASSEIKIYSEDYDESMDEIRIRTTIRNDELNRGWIGDLTYSTRQSYDIASASEVEAVAQSTYKDVLLASIMVYAVDEGHITWEYRFLKK